MPELLVFREDLGGNFLHDPWVVQVPLEIVNVHVEQVVTIL